MCMTFCWAFQTNFYDVGFSIRCKETGEILVTYSRVQVCERSYGNKMRPDHQRGVGGNSCAFMLYLALDCQAQHHLVTGHAIAEKPGTYDVLWDNSYSMFRKKTVSFQLLPLGVNRWKQLLQVTGLETEAQAVENQVSCLVFWCVHLCEATLAAREVTRRCLFGNFQAKKVAATTATARLALSASYGPRRRNSPPPVPFFDKLSDLLSAGAPSVGESMLKEAASSSFSSSGAAQPGSPGGGTNERAASIHKHDKHDRSCCISKRRMDSLATGQAHKPAHCEVSAESMTATTESTPRGKTLCFQHSALAGWFSGEVSRGQELRSNYLLWQYHRPP